MHNTTQSKCIWAFLSSLWSLEHCKQHCVLFNFAIKLIRFYFGTNNTQQIVMEARMHCKKLGSTISKAIHKSIMDKLIWKFYQGPLLQLQCLGASKSTLGVTQLHINTSKSLMKTKNRITLSDHQLLTG